METKKQKQKIKQNKKTNSHNPQFMVLVLQVLKAFENNSALLRLRNHRDFTGTQVINLKR